MAYKGGVGGAGVYSAMVVQKSFKKVGFASGWGGGQ